MQYDFRKLIFLRLDTVETAVYKRAPAQLPQAQDPRHHMQRYTTVETFNSWPYLQRIDFFMTGIIWSNLPESVIDNLIIFGC